MSQPRSGLDDLDLEVLKSRISEKWNTYPPEILPAWVAEMDFPLAEPIHRVLREAVERHDVGYPIAPRDTGLLEVFSERMAARFAWQVDPQRCEIITDVVQGLYVCLETLSDPGEGAVVQTPIYPPFLQAVPETGRRLVENRLVQRSTGFEIDFDALRRDVDSNTRLLLLCSPHNPTGRVFQRAELEALAELVLERDLIVVTDEIHGDLVFSGGEHIPFATLAPEIAARTVTLTSATKAFNIPGLRCAVAHFGSQALQERYNALPRHIGGGIGLLGLYATIAAWRESQPWLDEVRCYLEANRDFTAGFLAERLPEIVFHPPQATYLGWLDCSALELKPTPGTLFLRRGKVALSDGHYFGASFEQFARINFATSRSILGEVLERVESAVRQDAER
jgi:cystathionine beta-lyase